MSYGLKKDLLQENSGSLSIIEEDSIDSVNSNASIDFGDKVPELVLDKVDDNDQSSMSSYSSSSSSSDSVSSS